MKLRYLDGTEDDDPIFDRSEDDQRTYMARIIGCNPGFPEGWPLLIIDDLLNLRRTRGKPAFYREIGRLLSMNVK